MVWLQKSEDTEYLHAQALLASTSLDKITIAEIGTDVNMTHKIINNNVFANRPYKYPYENGFNDV